MRYLILFPHAQWLESLSLEEGLFKNSTLVLPHNSLETAQVKRLQPFLGEIIQVENYFTTGEVEWLVYKIFQKAPFDRIIAPDEEDILRAGRLRTLLDLEGQNYESALAFRDKIVMKEILAKKGIVVPPFRALNNYSDFIEFVQSHNFPIVLKPRLGTGCQGIHVLYSEDDVRKILSNPSVFSNSEVPLFQTEIFIHGPMYHINGLAIGERVICSWPSVYLHSALGIIAGTYAASSLLAAENPLTEKLNQYAKKIIKLMPTPQAAAFHLEVFMVDGQDEPVFCEIASRVGGKGVNHSWKTSFNIDLKKLFILMQANIDINVIEQPRTPSVISGEVWFPKIKGTLVHIENQCPFPWVKEYEVYSRPGDALSSPHDITEILGGTPLILGASEIELQKRIEDLEAWFYQNTKIS